MSTLLHHHFRQLARHAEWANQKLYDFCAQLDEDAYERQKQRASGGIHGLLNHLLVINKIWQARLKGYDTGIISPDKDLYDDFESLQSALIAEDVLLVELVRGFSEENMLQAITYKDRKGMSHTKNVEEMLTELFLQQAHIRGAIVYAFGDHFSTDELGYIRFLDMNF